MASGAIRKASTSEAVYPSFLSADSEAASKELASAFATHSPRLRALPMPVHAYAIYAGVFACWLALTSAALFSQNFFAWSVGVAYIGYDTLLVVFVATQIATLLRALPFNAVEASARPSVAIVVAAWNERDALPRTIDALLVQDDPAELIVIADDGSDDDTSSVLLELYGLRHPPSGNLSAPSAIHPSLRWLRLPHNGKPGTLNAALAHIATDIVVTVDADTILAPAAIAVIRKEFARDKNLVVGGGILTPVCDDTPGGRALQFFQRYEYIRNFMSRYAWSRVDALLLISGAFAAFRHDAVMAVGGFDRASLTEDYELIHRLQRYDRERRLGWRVRILGRAVATTGAPSSAGAFLRQRRRWFAGFLQTQFWNRDMTGTARFGALGLAMMPVKALDTMQPIYGLTAVSLLPIFLLTGRAELVVPAFGVMSLKVLIDLAYYFACIALYRRWTGDHATRAGVHALGAAIIEPFTFQPLRHAGAALGWVSLLTGNLRWGRASRSQE